MYICLTDYRKRSIHDSKAFVANIIWRSFCNNRSFDMNWEIKMKN